MSGAARRQIARTGPEGGAGASDVALARQLAHDQGNTLAGIVGRAQLALLELEPDHPARTHVQIIIDAAHRAAARARERLRRREGLAGRDEGSRQP